MESPERVYQNPAVCPACGEETVAPQSNGAAPPDKDVCQSKPISGGFVMLVGVVGLIALLFSLPRSWMSAPGKKPANNAWEITLPPPLGKLRAQEVAGLKIDLPGTPSRHVMNLSESMKETLSEMDLFDVREGSTSINIHRLKLRHAVMDLSGFAESKVLEAAYRDGMSDFKSAKAETVIDGLPAQRVTMTCMLRGIPLHMFAVFFSRGKEVWHVQAGGAGDEHREALEDLADRVFSSIRIVPGKP